MKRLLAILLLLLIVVTVYQPASAQTTYVVRAGDTLYRIATRFGVTVSAIASANQIVNPNLIFVGQVLTIPGSDDQGSPPPPVSPPPGDTQTYTVQPGDTLFKIAVRFGVTVQSLVTTNSLANPNLIFAGQQLIIPGGAAGTPPPPSPPPPAATATPAPPATGANLLPNPSFEGGYYNLYGAPELQVPNGWQMEIDEGVPAPGSGVTLLRPESRIVPRWSLPPAEQDLFVWDGNWAIKVFKGGAPASFRFFTDVPLAPGTYRFVASYFPDLVSSYGAGGKVWAAQPLAGEARFIQDGGGSGWQQVQPGARNSITGTFAVTTDRTVRVGLALRTRYVLANNGFFLDGWSLQRIGS